MNIIFFGSSRFVLPILDMLRRTQNLTLVVTTESSLTDPVIQFCREHALDYLSLSDTSEDDFISLLTRKNSQRGVFASFSKIVPQQVIAMFTLGIINVHPSLLPFYRGPTPIPQAILDGEEETGVSLISVDNKMDHGPLLAQSRYPLSGNETADELLTKLFSLAAPMLEQVLTSIEMGIPKENIAQDHTHATYTPLLSRESGFIHLADRYITTIHKHSAKRDDFTQETISFDSPKFHQVLERMIRAYHPWPGVWTRARLDSSEQEKIIKFLPGNTIQVEGKKPMTIKDFLNGYKKGRELLERLGLVP